MKEGRRQVCRHSEEKEEEEARLGRAGEKAHNGVTHLQIHSHVWWWWERRGGGGGGSVLATSFGKSFFTAQKAVFQAPRLSRSLKVGFSVFLHYNFRKGSLRRRESGTIYKQTNDSWIMAGKHAAIIPGLRRFNLGIPYEHMLYFGMLLTPPQYNFRKKGNNCDFTYYRNYEAMFVYSKSTTQ